MLTQKELNRYKKHIILPEFGIKAQLKLKNSKVLVIGAGGLGSSVLTYLTAAGIGTLGIVDFDVVSESNLQRQILFNESNIGKSKVKIAIKNLKKQNFNTNFIAYDFDINKKNSLEIIKKYDIVVDCSDNFETRFIINDACKYLKIPMIFGAVYRFEGHVSVFNFNGGADYTCLVPEIPNKNEIPTSSEIGIFSPLPGVIGSIQSSECIKILTGIGDILTGKLFIINLLNFSTNIIDLCED